MFSMAAYLIDACSSILGVVVAPDLQQAMDNEDKWSAIRYDIQSWYSKWISPRNGTKCERLDDVLITSEYGLIPSETSLSKSGVNVLLDWYRKHATAKSVHLYYLDFIPPHQLNRRLLDRGATLEARPHWMWCDLNCRSDCPSRPSDIDVKLVWEELKSPNPGTSILNSLAQEKPRTVFHIVAYRGDTVLGSCVLNTTADADNGRYNRVGGLYNMETKPEFRRQGIGLALSDQACNLAASLGLHYLYLNASLVGVSVYKKAGFEFIDPSWTWCLDTDALRTNQVSLR